MLNWFKKKKVYIVNISMRDHTIIKKVFSQVEDAYDYVMECNEGNLIDVYYNVENLKSNGVGSYHITGFNTDDNDYYIDIMEVH